VAKLPEKSYGATAFSAGTVRDGRFGAAWFSEASLRRIPMMEPEMTGTDLALAMIQ